MVREGLQQLLMVEPVFFARLAYFLAQFFARLMDFLAQLFARVTVLFGLPVKPTVYFADPVVDQP